MDFIRKESLMGIKDCLKALILASAGLILVSCSGSSPTNTNIQLTLKFAQTIGGEGCDVAYDIVEASDGGYVIAGATSSKGNGSWDVYLVKVDTLGAVVWDTTYGGADEDQAFAIAPTADGGYIVTGYTNSFSVDWGDIYLIKTDADGNRQWEYTYGTDHNQIGNDVAQSADGGYIITGWTSTSETSKAAVYMIKTEDDGDTVWTCTIDGTESDEGNAVLALAGGYLVAGATASVHLRNDDLYLLRFDADGDTLWSLAVDAQGNNWAEGAALAPDGGFVMVGWGTLGIDSGYDLYAARVSAAGSLEWQKTYGGPQYDAAFDIENTSDGGFIVVGHYGLPDYNGNRLYLVKLNGYGNEVWSQYYGDKSCNGRGVIQDNSGAYVGVGSITDPDTEDEDIYIVRVKEE